MPKVGTLGLDMMFSACTAQVSIFLFLCFSHILLFIFVSRVLGFTRS